jgi:hypothetical protein
MSKNKDPTRAQLSSRLQYQANVPAFLRRYQNQIAGRANTPSDDEEEWVEGAVDEFGREIRRPSPKLKSAPALLDAPEQDDRQSDDGELDDEAPQVVVIREGKHLTGEEAENERRKKKGLPLLEKSDSKPLEQTKNTNPSKSKSTISQSKPSLSFSSSAAPSARNKRKVGALDEASPSKNGKSTKKPKKEKKGLLSFGDGNE